MSEFLSQLKLALGELSIRATRVLLAVSGGPDSVAMLRGMHTVAEEFQLEIAVAHLNHNLRSDESTEDAKWLGSLCAALGIELFVENEDISHIAKQRGLGLEETARDARYVFFRRVAGREGISMVCLAHTANDDAETILHHIVRGTGFAGLRGMPMSRALDSAIVIVRPLLQIERKTVEHYLQEIGQEARCDRTNDDSRFTRNRIRKSLLPLLEEQFNPRVQDALRRLGVQAAEVQETLEMVANSRLDESALQLSASVCRLDVESLSQTPHYLLRECFRLLWQRNSWPRQRMGFAEWERLAQLVRSRGSMEFPGGIRCECRGNMLILQKRDVPAE